MTSFFYVLPVQTNPQGLFGDMKIMKMKKKSYEQKYNEMK